MKQAQQKLSAAGHDAGPADGIMGPKTQAALKEYQQSKNLQASGQLDQKTLAALGVSGGGSTASASSDTSGSASAGGTAKKSDSPSLAREAREEQVSRPQQRFSCPNGELASSPFFLPE